MSGYVQFGPFVDGSSPGISAEFLNPVETFLLQINSAAYDPLISSNGSGVVQAQAAALSPTGNTLIGSTSGQVTLYQIHQGLYKRVLLLLANFWNNGGSAQTIAIPTPFQSVCQVRTSAMYQLSLLVSGSAQNIAVTTALATGGGTTTTQTYIAAYSFGISNHPIDTVSFASGGSAAQSGLIILEGI